MSDLETYDFFGYNTTLLSSDRGLLGGLLDSFTGIYDNIVKDYVTDVYTDVIEGYSIATIKVCFLCFDFDLRLHLSCLGGSSLAQ